MVVVYRVIRQFRRKERNVEIMIFIVTIISRSTIQIQYKKFVTCTMYVGRIGGAALTCGTFIHSFISDMQHYECVVPNVDIILQGRRF